MNPLAQIAAACLAMASSANPSGLPAGPEGFGVEYLHSLSTTFGTVPLDAVRLNVDPMHREIFVMGEGLTRVYNDSGMELYTFEPDPNIGMILGVATLGNGDLAVLASREGGAVLLRCSFRGEYLGPLELGELPAEYRALAWHLLRQSGGKIYLANLSEMKVLVLDERLRHVASWDLAKLCELTEEQRMNSGVRGFNVDAEGNILFTIQVLFKAFVLSPDGALQSFGTKGGAPGKFNVVSGIARDDAGYYYVADLLKSAVIVFDPSFHFVREFGQRGAGVSGLASPEDVAVMGGRLYVSQHGRRGVSVFQIAHP